jgi:GNAT superfamily N-acetyltransferase
VTAPPQQPVICRGADGEPAATYRVTQDSGLPLAFDVEPARPGPAGTAAAAQALITALPGWRLSVSPDLAEQLTARGATVRRRLRTMLRDLAGDPPPVEWAQAPLGGPEAGGGRVVPCSRPAADLFPAWRAAYRPPHPDGFSGSDADALAERLVPLLAGAHGPVAPSWSRLVVDADERVVAGVVVLAAEPPLDMPWIGDVFRQPGPAHAGLGGALLQRVLSLIAADGVPQVGLAVTDGNPAARVYERLGFRTAMSTATVELP